MNPSTEPLGEAASEEADHATDYIGLADGLFLLLALWLTLATLPVVRPAAAESTPNVTIKPAAGVTAGAPSSSKSGEMPLVATHRLTTALERTDRAIAGGEIIIEVPPDVFQLLHQAKSVRVLTHK